ncbi:hypothetical protein K4A83_09405 [Spirulina subsalsa FACHB-351]|uniref:Uncharacterized protein n=1 Tax=Spirulina subsalsa FACHB-351 TaxID=234711 RepID=A0ABT3L4U8_9CYAN|nr:hypothetical protein [Spirulina subsalsa]MCW6036482.1 hypothetical protein [Spirulina subsalsa FACHB-351]
MNNNSLSARIAAQFYLNYQEQSFLPSLKPSLSSQELYQNLTGIMADHQVNISQREARNKLFIDMVIRGVCNYYRDHLILWHHVTTDDNFTQPMIPSYIVARRSPLQGKTVFDQPYLLLCEGQKGNFDDVWAVCLNKLVKVQRISQGEWTRTLFGIVSDGEIWQFSQLKGDLFIREPKNYKTAELSQLLAVMFHLFEKCQLQIISNFY